MRYTTWKRDKQGKAKVRRHGFQMVPDFSGTAHAYCGETLPAASADLLTFHEEPKRESMQKGYITLSRFEFVGNMLISQPCAPMLFRQGPLPGPNLLMEFL